MPGQKGSPGQFKQAIQAILAGDGYANITPLVERICSLDLAMQIGITLTMSDITTEEFVGLTILHKERANKMMREEMMAESRRRMEAKPIDKPFK